MKRGGVLRMTILTVMGIVWLIPVYLLIANAAKSSSDYRSSAVWLPGDPGAFFANVVSAFQLTTIGESLASTALYAIVAPAIAVVLGATIGFAIIVLRLNNGFFWFFVIFCGTVFPLQMIVTPLFDAYSRLRLFDTHVGMLIVYAAVCVPFCAFVMRNFFSGIAETVFEAAVVDGASTWRIFWRVYLPMSGSALLALFIIQATWVWNDLLLGLILTQDPGTRPVMTTVTALISQYSGGGRVTIILTAGLIVSLPTVLAFLFSQRFFSKGLALGQY